MIKSNRPESNVQSRKSQLSNASYWHKPVVPFMPRRLNLFSRSLPPLKNAHDRASNFSSKYSTVSGPIFCIILQHCILVDQRYPHARKVLTLCLTSVVSNAVSIKACTSPWSNWSKISVSASKWSRLSKLLCVSWDCLMLGVIDCSSGLCQPTSENLDLSLFPLVPLVFSFFFCPLPSLISLLLVSSISVTIGKVRKEEGGMNGVLKDGTPKQC